MNIGDVGHFFKSLGEKIHSTLVAIFGQPALDNVETQIKTVLQDDVRVIFMDAINAAQTLQASGADKRQAAFNQITTDLKSKGISLEQNVINLGIELVVGLIKSKMA